MGAEDMGDFSSRQEKNRSNTEVLRGFLTPYWRKRRRLFRAD
jgi:hypothetical protein